MHLDDICKHPKCGGEMRLWIDRNDGVVIGEYCPKCHSYWRDDSDLIVGFEFEKAKIAETNKWGK